jgi:quercetin dioxygenase-like cupin family protein
VTRPLGIGLALAVILVALPAAQTEVVTGDHDSPLRELAGEGNQGISNAVLRNQDDVRVLRVVVEPGGFRAMHSHDDVQFHMFIPVSGPMTLKLDGAEPVTVAPWHPYYMVAGTRHGFENPGSDAVEIMEVFVK